MNLHKLSVKSLIGVGRGALLALTVTFQAAGAGFPQLLSTRDNSIPTATQGNGHSMASTISRDGRYILFQSTANNLVTNDNGSIGLDAFLFDQQTGDTLLASQNSTGNGGGNADSFGVQVSANGRYVLLESSADNLIPGDTNQASDIIVRDTQLNINDLISVATDGRPGNGPSMDPVMTPDGRWVAFVSAADNLVAGDTNGLTDLFLRDRALGATTRITGGASGPRAAVSSPAVTPFGRFVTFVSTAKGMDTNVASTLKEEVYLYDAVLNEITWVSSNAAARAESALGIVNAPSFHPRLSDEGRFVVYKTGWTNGTWNGTPGTEATILSIYDAVLHSTTLISTNGFPPWPLEDDVYGPELTPDGRYVAYVKREGTNTSPATSIQLWDRLTGTTVAVSAPPSGALPADSISNTPQLSEDGRFVAFISNATNLTAATVSDGHHLYRRDLLLSATALVDSDIGGIGSVDLLGALPSMTADGSLVTYSAKDGLLVDDDTNKAFDVFLWDEATGSSLLVSTPHPQATASAGNAPSTLGRLTLSDNGLAAYSSYASDLVTNDFNRDADVFVRDLSGESNLLASVGLDGNAGTGGGSFAPVLSKDGRFVIFLSWATNLTADDPDRSGDIFRRDLLTGTTVLVSTNLNGANIMGLDCDAPQVSDDGRVVTWIGYPGAASSLRALLWRDLGTGKTRVVSTTPHLLTSRSISADGGRLAYFDSAADLHVWDAGTNGHIYSNTENGLTSAALSPLGDRLLIGQPGMLKIALLDVPGIPELPDYPSTVPVRSEAQWSGDGRYLAFATDTGLAPQDNNNARDVYLQDLQTTTLTLLSVNAAGTFSANGASEWPVVSRDGRFVLFRSLAKNIAAGITTPASLILFDRETGSNTLVATGTSASRISSRMLNPVLSSNGTWLAFQSWDAGLAVGDFNRSGDAFGADVDAPPLTDSDGDGIPDWWMMAYFGHPTGEAGDLSRADDDGDSDGLTTLEEYLAGTDPGDTNSRLALQISPSPTPGWLILRWEANAGRTYQLKTTVNVDSPPTQIVGGGLTVVGKEGSKEIERVDTQRYFRLEANRAD